MEQLTPQQRRLAEDHWPDARRTAASFRRRYRRDLDWEGACALALCRAARDFDLERGVPFGCFLAPCLSRACLDLLKSSGPLGYRTGRAEAPLPVLPLDVNPAAAELPVGWEVEWHDQLESLARLLPPDEGRVLWLLYGHAAMRRQTRVAEALAVSTSQVSRVHEASLERLRRTFAVAPGHP